jgi:hypothetical protein
MITFWVFMSVATLVLHLTWRWVQYSTLQIALDPFRVTTITTESSDSTKRFSLEQAMFSGNMPYRRNLAHAVEDSLTAGLSIHSAMPDKTQYFTGSTSQDSPAAFAFCMDGGETFTKAERQTYRRESHS